MPCVLPLPLARRLGSPLGQLGAVLLQLGMYLFDVCMDVYVAHRLFTYWSASCPGGHPFFGSVMVALVCAPGALTATQALLDGRATLLESDLRTAQGTYVRTLVDEKCF